MSESTQPVPAHIAIIMDGNGRWARKRNLPRAAGHRAGVRTLKQVVEQCAQLGIDVLTVFAFSSENWQRPAEEVSMLLDLFVSALHDEVDALHENNVHLQFIGERSVFPDKLQASIGHAEQKTGDNTGLRLFVAANYGGRWDIMQACRQLLAAVNRGDLVVDADADQQLAPYLCLAEQPEPDLFIRTGGEQRISNFLLWQMAYTELYFTPTLWPDFTATDLSNAIRWYAGRQRRFGKTSAQVSRHG